MELPANPKREAKSQFALTIPDRLKKELTENKFDQLAMRGSDIARAVVHAVSQPDNVDISEIRISPISKN